MKIPVEVKGELKKLGIKLEKLLKRAIYGEIRRREIEEIEKDLKELAGVLEGFTKDFVVKSIREDRYSR